METAGVLSKEEVLLRLQELTQGLCYMSESDYPLEVVHYESIPASVLTKEAVLSLTGSALENSLEVTDLAYFFRNLTKPSNSSAERYKALETFLEQQLQDVKVYHIGRRTINAFILGRLPEGDLIGLKTKVIQSD